VAERKRETSTRPPVAETTPSGARVAPASSRLESRDERPADAPSHEPRPETSTEVQTAGERTEVIPRGELRTADAGRSTTPTRASWGRSRRPRPGARRSKRTLTHIDPVSVLKLSLFYYACFVVLWLVVVAILYTALSAMGLVERLERLGRLFVLWESIDISLWFVERWAFLVGLTCAVAASLVNVFLAFLYNLAADVVGGAEMTFLDRDI
jgi:hypothetical protein